MPGNTPVLDTAFTCIKVGISVVPPTEDGEKKPISTWKQYQERLPSHAQILDWYASGRTGIGVVTGKVSGNLEVLDFDTPEIYQAFLAFAYASGFSDLVDRLRAGYEEHTPNGAHLPYRCEIIEGNTKLAQRPLRDEQGQQRYDEYGNPKVKTLIETRGEGGFCIIAPSNGKVHETGKPYVMQQGSLTTIATITPAERTDLFFLCRTFDEMPKRPSTGESRGQRTDPCGDRPGDLYNARASWEEVLETHGWKRIYERNGVTYWRRPGKERGISASTNYQGSDLLYVFSTSTPFESERGYSKFSAFALLHHSGDFEKAAEALAKAGYKPDRSTRNGSRPAPEDSSHFRLTDLGNAERFIARHGQDLLFCNPWGKWLVWDGKRWKIDNTQQVRQWTRATVRVMYEEAGKLSARAKSTMNEEERRTLAGQATTLLQHATRSEAEIRLNAMIHNAQMDCPILPEQLDAALWTLNVANGTLDLRTGALLPYRREDRLTKFIPVVYQTNATAPQWEDFLSTILAGKKDVIDFLWKAIGYSLTGDTREDCLFLLHGAGANGKSTFLSILRALLGEYGQQATFSTFLYQDRDTERNDLADLRGARLVVASEVEEGKRLSESIIKALTGRDLIKARFLFQEHFEFTPQMKLWLATNHRPIIRGTDHAIWRRIRLIPFTVTFEGRAQDKELPDKLRAELPGILAWAVRGCLAWQQGGLPLPETVKAATEEYRSDMDAVTRFLEETCILRPESTTPSSSLYSVYTKWCEQAGEYALSQTALASRLKDRGYENDRNTLTGKRQWKGIGLKNEDG